MAIKTKAQILAEISSLLADNTTGDISAQDVRTVVNDITDSYEDIITAGTTSQYWRGDKTWQNFPTNEVTGTLSAAQINALDTTDVTLLSAPGANKYYVIESCAFHYKSGGTGFTINNTDLVIVYGTSGVGILFPIPYANLQSTTSDVFISIPAFVTTAGYVQTGDLSTGIINDSIVIKMPGGGTISGGNGTINFSIKYRIVTTS